MTSNLVSYNSFRVFHNLSYKLTYSFSNSDALHLSPSPTRELYETKIRPVVRAAMSGFNGTVFA